MPSISTNFDIDYVPRARRYKSVLSIDFICSLTSLHLLSIRPKDLESHQDQFHDFSNQDRTMTDIKLSYNLDIESKSGDQSTKIVFAKDKSGNYKWNFCDSHEMDYRYEAYRTGIIMQILYHVPLLAWLTYVQPLPFISL